MVQQPFFVGLAHNAQVRLGVPVFPQHAGEVGAVVEVGGGVKGVVAAHDFVAQGQVGFVQPDNVHAVETRFGEVGQEIQQALMKGRGAGQDTQIQVAIRPGCAVSVGAEKVHGADFRVAPEDGHQGLGIQNGPLSHGAPPASAVPGLPRPGGRYASSRPGGPRQPGCAGSAPGRKR